MTEKKIVHTFKAEAEFKIPDSEYGACLRALNKHHVGIETVNKIAPFEPGGFRADPKVENHPNKAKLEAARWSLTAQLTANITVDLWSDGTKTVRIES